MDGQEATPAVDPSSISCPSSPFQERRARSREPDLDEPNKRVKRVKLRDLDTVMRLEEGIRSCSTKPNEKKTEKLETSIEDENASQITKGTDLRLSNNPADIPMNNHSLETDAVCSLQSSMVTCELEAENVREICRASLLEKRELKSDPHAADLPRLGVDLNNPFYPYKKLGQVRATDPSECGSTTGPMENNESMRRWNEMKQNGFVSLAETVPSSKPRHRQPKKKKIEEMKKRSNTTKAELANKGINVGAPSGLLSGLNPGIIKHVRNSKQVNSIIEAMLQSEKVENQELQHKPLEQSRSGRRGANVGSNERRNALVSDQLDLSLNEAFNPACFGSRIQSSESDMPDYKFNNDSSNTSVYNSEFDDDALTLKLSSGIISTEHASGAAIIDFSLNQENTTSLSFKAAGVASQWLGLIQQDIKGRLAALRRSKKRVKNAIQIELAFLLTRDLAPHSENESMLHSSLLDCPRKETLDMHMARWKNLFGQMEKSLMEEGKNLERWLRQVEELQAQCEKGLKYVSINGLSNLDSIEDASAWKNKESWERECAVRAAAASIYSTSNLIMTAR
ncbi:uncharacterized protein LOC110019436 isoform X2 [Phalaenopsis equestris]|uniref:uncharacterized protein LOC110019436 isoform X2 n=1 Tax=Phalaenopsis equestris TaxID=78828 RepID=UPI0009E2BE6D|nr:uncharacterized protein LOC110019436 isoform X2 [Phalaenopsis equestris]XP_020572754.1 uncharacterized protein LOC110019436 isoform X2 [Phalaenopsis equestris]